MELKPKHINFVSFYWWVISRYYGKDNPRGDFAYDIKRDNNWPIFTSNRTILLDYLHSKHACEEIIELFKRIWRDYNRERKLYIRGHQGSGSDH